MRNLKDTFSILRSSLYVLRKDKELIIFPFLCAVMLILVFIGFVYSTVRLYPEGAEVLRKNPFFYGFTPYLQMFIFIFAVHFVITFFNAAVVASAARRFSGENPTVITDFSDVFKHLAKIAGWVFLISIVVFIMNFFKKKGWLGKIIGQAVEIAAEIACFFVIPVIMIENQNPVNAIRRSTQMMWDSWGRQIAGNLSLYLIVSLIQIPGIILLVLAFDITNPHKITLINSVNLGFGAVYIAFISAIYNTLVEIFRVALYLYVRDGKAPEGFEVDSLQQAFVPA